MLAVCISQDMDSCHHLCQLAVSCVNTLQACCSGDNTGHVVAASYWRYAVACSPTCGNDTVCFKSGCVTLLADLESGLCMASITSLLTGLVSLSVCWCIMCTYSKRTKKTKPIDSDMIDAVQSPLSRSAFERCGNNLAVWWVHHLCSSVPGT